jgi:DNA invertase Pin-like site-specific DNA recombinase
VEQHTESRIRQYQLLERAQSLGWPAAQCQVIDDDQGISGAQSHNRPGYQRLTSLIALRQVGIVLGLEASRLARNNLDWYQLLDLAAAFDVLIADEDGLYASNDFNDRLLLGLKGTISEVELYQMRSRMVRARLSKARRGELSWSLPIGLDPDPVTGRTRLAVDQEVRHSLESVFRLFAELRSVRGVLNYLRRTGLQLPYRRWRRGFTPEVAWRQPSYDVLYHILTNPAYAGAYCYGRRKRQLDPFTHRYHVQWLEPHQWEVFIPDHHPGYISLAQFEENQRILKNNRNRYPDSQGAVRNGPALLQGLVTCQHCGARMRVRYSHGQPYYTCDRAHRRFGEPICNRASAGRVDTLVEELFLTVVNQETLELSLHYHEKLVEEATLVDQGWQDKLKRLDYQADLARRRYQQVDPENRLVAQTLETEWDQRLLELEKARRDYEASKPDGQRIASTAEEMRQVVAHLRDYWYGEGITEQDKKELLRCLVERVLLESRGKVIRAQINWYGGGSSELDVPKYLFSTPHSYHRVRDLARSHTEREIAALLNQAGIKTAKGKEWSPRMVMDFRRSNAIASEFTTAVQLRAPDGGYLTSAEAAGQLGVNQGTIQRWYRLGLLPGKHDGGQSILWIQWTEEVRERLMGGAAPHPKMVSVKRLCREQGRSPSAILAWAQNHGHTIYRLRRGSVMRFFILPADSSKTLQ